MADTGSRSGEATRARLVAAAASAFSHRGFHGTTTAEIAAAAGCSEPTLFKYFGSKHALLVAALRETASQLLDELDPPRSSPDETGVDPFDEFAGRARLLLGDPRLAQLSRLRNYALAASDEVDLGSLTTGLATFLERIANAIAAGQRSGSIRRDVDPGHAADLVFSLTLLYGTRSAIAGNETAAAELSPVVDTLIDLLRAPERQ